MIIKCCLCGKEEKSFYNRPLDKEMPEYSLCTSCSSMKATIEARSKGANIRDKQIDKSKQYIIMHLNQNAYIETDVRKYFEQFISTVTTDIEKEIQMQHEIENRFSELQESILLTTGYDFQGYKIVDYINIISSEYVIGTGILSEFTSSVTDTFGMKSSSFSNKISEAKQNVLDDMKKKTIIQNGNAIIGINFQIATFSNNMIAIMGTGTCVKIKADNVITIENETE
jgi:uncharacterized protein YbjQ (UPF0145 family)